MPLLRVAYVLPMTRLRLIVIFIVMFVILYPSKRRTRESHEGNACKETQPILQEGVILGYHVLKKRVSDTCTRKMVSRPALKLHEADNTYL